jgi:hypothetical protein
MKVSTKLDPFLILYVYSGQPSTILNYSYHSTYIFAVRFQCDDGIILLDADFFADLVEQLCGSAAVCDIHA